MVLPQTLTSIVSSGLKDLRTWSLKGPCSVRLIFTAPERAILNVDDMAVLP